MFLASLIISSNCLLSLISIWNNKLTILLLLVTDLATSMFPPLSDIAIVASRNKYGLSIASISSQIIIPVFDSKAQDTSIILSPF